MIHATACDAALLPDDANVRILSGFSELRASPGGEVVAVAPLALQYDWDSRELFDSTLRLFLVANPGRVETWNMM